MGDNVDFTQPITSGPIACGFYWYFGISASLNMSPFCYIENDRPFIIPTIASEPIQTEFLSVDQGMRSPDFTISDEQIKVPGTKHGLPNQTGIVQIKLEPIAASRKRNVKPSDQNERLISTSKPDKSVN